MGRPAYKGASFDPEEAEKAVVAPTLFKSLQIHCPVCGVKLLYQRYAFFPSMLYIEGYCVRCDDQRSAFFAPEPETLPEAPSVPGAADAIIDDFMGYLTEQHAVEDTTPRPRLRVISGTDIDDKPDVTDHRVVDGASPSDVAP